MPKLDLENVKTPEPIDEQNVAVQMYHTNNRKKECISYVEELSFRFFFSTITERYKKDA